MPEFANCKPEASNKEVCRHIATLTQTLESEQVIALFKWVLANGCTWDEYVAPRLAKRNKLDVLKWCHENEVPIANEAATAAARGGYVETIAWINQIIGPGGPMMQKYIPEYIVKNDNDTSEQIIDKLKWCQQNGYTIDKKITHASGSSGKIAIITWLNEQNIH